MIFHTNEVPISDVVDSIKGTAMKIEELDKKLFEAQENPDAILLARATRSLAESVFHLAQTVQRLAQEKPPRGF